jgi:hypothetical protein
MILAIAITSSSFDPLYHSAAGVFRRTSKNGAPSADPHRQNSDDYFEFWLDIHHGSRYYN